MAAPNFREEVEEYHAYLFLWGLRGYAIKIRIHQIIIEKKEKELKVEKEQGN